MKHYAYIGSWGRISPDCPLGIHLLEYSEGSYRLIETYDIDMRPACICKDGDMLYVPDEVKGYKGAPNGGGRIVSYKIMDDGRLEKHSWQKSYGVNATYLALSMDKRFIVLANHSIARGGILKSEKTENGYRLVMERDEANVVLLPVSEDGTIGEALDIIRLQDICGEKHPNAMPHYVRRHPNEDTFFVVENGEDRIYTFKLDKEQGKLVLQKDRIFHADPKSNPRYFASTQDFKYHYVTDEFRPFVNVLKYDENGFEQIQSIRLVPEDQPILQDHIGAPAPISPSAAILSPDEKYLYAACRGTNTLTMFEIGEDHLLTPIQIVNSEGNNPRTMAIDPDGKRLTCCNIDSDKLSVFLIDEKGMLTYEDGAQIPCPGFILFS